MKLTSSAFAHGTTIPEIHTADGQDVSPPLAWTGVPDGTASLALICDDPDAPSRARPAAEPWVHWVIFNIPAERSDLPAGISRTLQPPEVPDTRQGVNSWPSDNVGYLGPEPPRGSGEHRYIFQLYALDTQLKLKPGATKHELLEAMSGHILADTELIGIYQR
jgi:Raf kinase inhibitor-like YbhB/YbcL family protein